jgi:hypothetical protein
MYCFCGCGQEVQGERKSRKFVNDAHKQAYWRRQHQQDQAQGSTFTEMLSELIELREKCHDQAQTITALEQENTRILSKLDIERRFREDHEMRGFKAWLKRQPMARTSEIERRMLSDDFIPSMGSRAVYEAHLRKNGYTPDEIERFRDVWKLMLLS